MPKVEQEVQAFENWQELESLLDRIVNEAQSKELLRRLETLVKAEGKAKAAVQAKAEPKPRYTPCGRLIRE